MSHELITIISRIENDLQAWTFYITETDLLRLIDTYGSEGCNIRGDTQTMADEIQNVYD